MTHPSPASGQPLFSSLRLAGLDLRNRFVMSPMTRQQAEGGVLKPTDYYLKRAQGGVGLIVSEGITIDHPVADYTLATPYLFGAEALSAWRTTVSAVQAAGAPMFAQLWHTGLRRPVDRSRFPALPSAGPSGVYPDFPGEHPPLTETEIERIIAAFGAAAASARAVGFSGVNVHAGHGYLVDQFLWAETNRRTDAWGGSTANRVRFAVEVVKAIKRAAGSDFPVMFRFSQWKTNAYEVQMAPTPSILAQYLEPLADAGVDIFDASTRRYWRAEFPGSDLNLAGWTRKLTGVPTMTVGSVGLAAPLDTESRLNGRPEQEVASHGLDRLYEMFARGDFDFVGVGRALLANPDWVDLVRTGRFGEIKGYGPETAAQAVI